VPDTDGRYAAGWLAGWTGGRVISAGTDKCDSCMNVGLIAIERFTLPTVDFGLRSLRCSAFVAMQMRWTPVN